MKKAIITGITGQDGSLLKGLLEKKKYKILGLSRKNHKEKNIIKTNYSKNSLLRIINKFKPNEVYHLAGLSRPYDSWIYPSENLFSNVKIVLNLLEIIKEKKNIKLFNACSSEIFQESNKPLKENSKIFPINPYGIAKSASFFLANAYRKKYNLFVTNGILFNHSSHYSKDDFILKYLLNSSKKIIKKNINKIELNDSRPIRDYGCAKEFVLYYYKLIKLKKSGNFIIASGKSYSVKQVLRFYKKKFSLKNNQFKFKNNIDFNSIYKVRIANNRKLKRALKIKSIKKLPEVIDILKNDIDLEFDDE